MTFIKAVGRFDPTMKTRYVAVYPGAPLRATKAEAREDALKVLRDLSPDQGADMLWDLCQQLRRDITGTQDEARKEG